MARIAITTGALRVPPTYFVVQHAQRLADAHDFEVFARIAEVTDPDLGVVVHDATAFESSLPYARRAPFSVVAGRRMTRQLADFAPDLVHQHFGTWSAPAISAARAASAPLVTTLHGYDVFAARAVAGRGGGVRGSLGAVATGSPGSAWHAANVRRSGARSTRLLAVSRYLADEAVAAGMPAERLEVHYQGIDADYFTPAAGRGSADAADDIPVLLFVGAFAARKGPQDLLAASLALIGAGVEHRVVFVGQGPLESELREAARTHPHVTVAGALGRDGVRELMRE
ncbi:MAG: glycosyltransferase, partial [Microbacteriaceae bacterium]